MNSRPPVPAETPQLEERFTLPQLVGAPQLDPFGELRTIPAGWHVAEMLSPSWEPANNHVLRARPAGPNGFDQETASMTEAEMIDFYRFDWECLDIFSFHAHREMFSRL